MAKRRNTRDSGMASYGRLRSGGLSETRGAYSDKPNEWIVRAIREIDEKPHQSMGSIKKKAKLIAALRARLPQLTAATGRRLVETREKLGVEAAKDHARVLEGHGEVVEPKRRFGPR